MGEGMAARYEHSEQTRERWNFQEESLVLMRRAFKSAGSTLPLLVLYFLAPKPETLQLLVLGLAGASAVGLARLFEVPEVVIGMGVVAIGTSLPELAAGVMATLRGHLELAIGNVVGSNILNILAVLSVPALVDPTAIEFGALWRDGGMMLALTLMLALFAYGINSRAVITRFEGAVMLMAWVGYNLLLIQQA